jgi:lipoprotein NlpD
LNRKAKAVIVSALLNINSINYRTRRSNIKIIINGLFSTTMGFAHCQAPQGLYQVKAGDTLAMIALSNGISPRDLVLWNSGIDPNQIVVGQILSLTPPPGIASQQVASGSPTPNFIWPTKGKVLKGFNEASRGIDIQGNIGDPVIASADGVVVFAGNGLKGYGNLIIIKHDNTYLTAYAHNSKLLVSEKQNVSKGQKISEVGDSDSDSPKLHFEVRANGKLVNPEPYLNGVAQASTVAKSSISMDDYKNKCKELGFKQGSEDFGKCVLQLSK